ncbi:hypothetical protein MD484_g2852, partial [Candolleomyces efflorescens]
MQINTVDILILGAGWTSTFLIPLCKDRNLTYAATTRDGRDGTIPFEFNPDPPRDELDEERERERYRRVLPDAKTVLITFPIKVRGASERLVRSLGRRGFGMYVRSFLQVADFDLFYYLFIYHQFGGAANAYSKKQGQRKGSGARGGEQAPPKPIASKWYDRHTPVTPGERADAESELLALSPEFNTTVLNLAGLWGGARSARNWVNRVAPTKEALRLKGSIHLIHGLDVSRAILAVHSEFSNARGQRWILSDGRVYDWWDLASAWGLPNSKSTTVGSGEAAGNLESTVVEEDENDDGERGPHARWVRELMEETGIRALPRNVELLGRAMDSREFWTTFGLSPVKARLE